MSHFYSVPNGRWVDIGPKIAADLKIGRDQFERFNDVWDGLLFRLARDPEGGYAVQGGWVMETLPTGTPSLPRIAVIYQFDTSKVYLMRVRAKP